MEGLVRVTGAAVLAGALLAGCSVPVTDGPGPTGRPAVPSGSPETTGPPSVEQPLVPLALVVHRSRVGLDVTQATARSVIAGAARSWAALGGRPGALTVL